ncbi:peptidylprolyl isomerase [Paenibacillus harenae]|uniref:peptidylprolyl isomerase n=1 Tax=Paenibacillus harenae TaxID=306543 RepID=UPI0003F7E286|nr:peptidylprolyl isomerase [Paenibacillus harenae]
MTLSNQAIFRLIAAAAAIALLLAGCGGKNDGLKQSGDAGSAVKTLSWSKMPEMTIDLNKTYKARFQTSKGEFTVRLYADEAPVTVNNFVFLAREGFYDGLTFHSIIESFMIQSGDPKGNGTGTPGYSIPDELDTDLKFEEGIVAMANLSRPNSGGSQFFICTGPDAANLNREPNYTIFGKVESGMNVVREIAQTPVKNNMPTEKIIIDSIHIEES